MPLHAISSLAAINNGIDEQILLASGDSNEYVKVWDMESHDCILSFKSNSGDDVTGLELIRSGGKICLLTTS